MKRILTLSIVLCLLFGLTACSMGEYKQARELFDNGQFDEAYHILSSLGDYKDSSEWASKCKESINNDLDLMITSAMNNGAVSFSELRLYIIKHGEEVICDGRRAGYYDNEEIRKKNEDEDYWFDPLSNTREEKGEVGFQHITVQHLFTGDLMVEVTTKVFYGLNESDYGNSANATLFYKGKYIWSDFLEIRDFLGSTSSGVIYALPDDSNNFRLFLVCPNSITAMHCNYKIVRIQRDGEQTAEEIEEERILIEEKAIAAYENAEALFAAGDYDGAIAVFEHLGDFRDSVKRAEESREARNDAEYKKAEELFNQGKYYDAYLAFSALSEYKDSKECSLRSWSAIIEKARAYSQLISVGGAHSVAVNSSGHVMATGSNYRNQCDVQDWQDIVAVSARNAATLGLHVDGTVSYTGGDSYDVSKWRDIVAISVGNAHAVGLRADGTVVAVGYNKYGQCDVSTWTDIVAICAGDFHTVGLRANGTVVAAGDNARGACDVSEWKNIVALAAGCYHTVGVRSDGTVVSAGNYLYDPCNVTRWSNIVAVSAGSYHTLGLCADGTVVKDGSNDKGPCDVSDWTDIIAISTCYECTLGLRLDGTVVAVGDNSSGQCNVSEWTNISIPNT